MRPACTRREHAILTNLHVGAGSLNRLARSLDGHDGTVHLRVLECFRDFIGDTSDAHKKEEDEDKQGPDQVHEAFGLLLLAPQSLAAGDDLMHIDAECVCVYQLQLKCKWSGFLYFIFVMKKVNHTRWSLMHTVTSVRMEQGAKHLPSLFWSNSSSLMRADSGNAENGILKSWSTGTGRAGPAPTDACQLHRRSCPLPLVLVC